MPESITINKKLGIIEIESYENVTYEEGRSTVHKLLDMVRDSGIRKVISDTRRQAFRPSSIKVYNLGNHLPRNVQFALVVSSKQPTSESISFLNTVARNRGIHIKTFESKNKALAWLLE